MLERFMKRGYSGVLILVLSHFAHADVTMKVEIRVFASGGVTEKIESKSMSVYYIKNNNRRHDMFGPSGSHTAIIRYCGSGDGYFVDFDRREYYQLSTLGHPNSKSDQESASQQQVRLIVKSDTREIDKPKMFFGHVAHHLVTTVLQYTEPQESGHAEELIDGWYLADIKQPLTNCMPESTADDPSSLIGVPVLPKDGMKPEFKHSGPLPDGLAAKVRRTSHSPLGDTSQGSSAVLEREVVDLSDKKIDPSMFEIPAEFQRRAGPHN